MRRVFGLGVVAGLALLSACGNGSPGPTAAPDAVVHSAPDITLGTKTAHVVGAAPGITATGRVDFQTGVDELNVVPTPTGEVAFGVEEPAAVLDMLRGVTGVRSYGGAEVQGIGTKRYEVDIDLGKAIAKTPTARQADLHLLDGKLGKDKSLWADVFVDRQGRVRRVLLPVHTAMVRPYGEDQHIPQLVSVDYSDFGGK